MSKALFVGSFNPFHEGHYNVYLTACNMFDEVYIGIAKNPEKDIDFKKIKWSIHPLIPADKVVIVEGSVAEYAFDNGFCALVRGVRNGFDLDVEVNMAEWNKRLGMDTCIIPTQTKYSHISSSSIRNVFALNSEASNHAINDNEVINEHVLTRWTMKNPEQIIYVGKYCSGKSTYLNKQKWLYVGYNGNIESMSLANIDSVVWKYTNLEQTEFKSKVRNSILEQNFYLYKDLMDEFVNSLKHFKLNMFDVLDFPTYGLWENITTEGYNTTVNSKIILIECEESLRKELLEKRYEQVKDNFKNKEEFYKFVETLDDWFVKPYIIDEVIEVSNG